MDFLYDLGMVVLAVAVFAVLIVLDRPPRPRMTLGEALTFVVAVLLSGYLIFALLRGENL